MDGGVDDDKKPSEEVPKMSVKLEEAYIANHKKNENGTIALQKHVPTKRLVLHDKTESGDHWRFPRICRIKTSTFNLFFEECHLYDSCC